ncbi:MAG: peptidase dimerization domain-containing protein, partial [Bdellovibrionales bacterium]|nr:peptidase dimerization domain-containing protein [Bdellovibrionales bacterium]
MGAQDRIEIEVRGRGGHASAPHLCVDPVFIGSQIVTALQAIVARSTDPFHAVVVTISVFQAGTVGNVIPDNAILRGTIRTLTREDRERVHEQVRAIAEGIASAHGGTASVVIEPGYPVLVNDDDAAEFVRRVGADIAPKGCSEFQPILGAEDFAYYAEECPAAFWFLGLRDGSKPHPNWHEATFDFNDAAIPYAIRMHVELARRFAASER